MKYYLIVILIYISRTDELEDFSFVFLHLQITFLYLFLKNSVVFY